MTAIRKSSVAANLFALATFATVGMSAPAFAEPADIVRDNGCYFFDALGDPYFDPSAEVQFVFTDSDNDNVNVSCKGILTGGVFPSSAMHFDAQSTGFGCVNSGNEDWKSVTTPSGRAHFSCHVPTVSIYE